MPDARTRLREISGHLQKGEAPETVTVREFLSWFGAQRRGYWIVEEIRSALNDAGLVTEPDFEGAYIDFTIAFAVAPVQGAAPAQAAEIPVPTPPDPTYRIGKLASANRKPVAVRPDDTVEKAVTLMLLNDFSQLPVTTSERDVKGVLSWKSIGSRLALGRGGDRVRLCMDPHAEISSEKSLFETIAAIVSNQYVLIRNSENIIAGIVTTSDLSLQFQQLGEPFLLLGEIENYVRRMIQDTYTLEELREAQDPGDADRLVERASDLTFGEYGRLLENPDRWAKLKLAIDRGEFIGKLNQVRKIRNDVMHFDPDGIPESDLKVLRDFVQFLQDLAAFEAI